MKVGLNITGLEEFYDGRLDGVLEVVARADEKGVDIVYCSDHLGFSRGAHEERRKSFGFPFPLATPWFEPIALLSAAAVLTRRIRLSTFVMVATLRPALLLAKQIATLDVLSKGRATMSLGVGWQEDEYRAGGMAFQGRFSDLEDQITAMRSLWNPPSRAEGRTFSFEDFHSLPTPVQGENLPLLLGLGPSPRNLDRIARLAQGWAMAPKDRLFLAEGSDQLKRLFEKYDRDPSGLEIHVGQNPAFNQDGSLNRTETAAQARASQKEGATTVSFLATGFCRSAEEVEDFLDFIVDLKS